MKMQEVIVRLRGIAPEAACNVRLAHDLFAGVHDVLLDATHATSAESVKALTETCLKKANAVQRALERAWDCVKELDALNQAYKEKLGPRAKKPKDAPAQQMLPGLEEVANG